MNPEEAENCRDNMEIDGNEPEMPAQRHADVMPDEFNANYLKAYYGNSPILSSRHTLILLNVVDYSL